MAVHAQVPGVCVDTDPRVLERLSQAVEWESARASSSAVPSLPASYATDNSDSLLADDLLSPMNQKTDLSAGLNADDPLSSMGPDRAMEAQRAARQAEEKSYLDQNGVDPHAEAFANTMYPSAVTCAKCHKKIYDEWRGSAHAYAGISPMFHRFEQAVQDIVRGTVGTFCLRCHAPVATQLKVPRHASLLEGPIVLR